MREGKSRRGRAVGGVLHSAVILIARQTKLPDNESALWGLADLATQGKLQIDDRFIVCP